MESIIKIKENKIVSIQKRNKGAKLFKNASSLNLKLDKNSIFDFEKKELTDLTNSVKFDIIKSAYRGVMSPTSYKESDFVELKKWNINLIRWQIRTSNRIFTSFDDYNNWLNDKLNELDKVIETCQKLDIKVVIALFMAPGNFTELGHYSIFTDEKANKLFIDNWKKIAARYNANPIIYAYDLINEPDRGMKSTDLIYQKIKETYINCISEVRKIDNITPICVYKTFQILKAGQFEFDLYDFENIIYQVHLYRPGVYTHQFVYGYDKAYTYPGIIDGVYYDREVLKSHYQLIKNCQERNSLKIFVGEFSAVRWAVGAAQYLKDCIEIFESFGWDWSYHSFREWDGWNLEMENGIAKDKPIKSIVNTDRKNVILEALKKNCYA